MNQEKPSSLLDVEAPKTNNGPIIKCPHCGAEFVPSEIFMPGELIGKANKVIKDPNNRILYVEYAEDWEPATVAHFTCDVCDKSFTVEPVIMYKVKKEAEELDFQNESVSLLD